jgi:hypothetical protein
MRRSAKRCTFPMTAVRAASSTERWPPDEGAEDVGAVDHAGTRDRGERGELGQQGSRRDPGATKRR